MQTLDRVHNWLFEQALPFWQVHGQEPSTGGFTEQLDLSGTYEVADFKRTRVACRQIYVFSHAEILGWRGGAEIAARGLRYISERAWLGQEYGWACVLHPDGSVKDRTPNLYDLAFVLFALGWFVKATGDPSSARLAGQTLRFIRDRMRHPSGVGYVNCIPDAGPRAQNPHMHLLEASLICFEATNDSSYLDLAVELSELFRNHFFDGETGCLGEFYNDDLTRVQGALGIAAEPGHHFEWVWILKKLKDLSGISHVRESAALAYFAEDCGVDDVTKAVYNTVSFNGRVVDAGSRAWPNAERIKAAVAMAASDAQLSGRMVSESANLLLNKYCSRSPAGTWIDAFDENGAAVSKSIPASTLYHLFLAFSEALSLDSCRCNSPAKI